MSGGGRRDRLDWAPIVAVVAVAAAVRLAGLQFGLPLVQARPDEQVIASKAVGFWATGDLNPHFFDYPSFYLYVTAALYGLYFLWGLASGRFDSVAAFAASWPSDWVPFFLIPRVAGALSGTVTVLVVYAIARRLFDRATALVAGLFMALAFLHVRDSHYGTTDVPMTLLLMLAMLFVVRAHQDGRTKDVVLSGVFGGLAMATKYNAVMLALPMAASAAIRMVDAPAGARSAALRAARPLLLVAVGALTFSVASPFVLLDPRQVLRDLDLVADLHSVGMTPPEVLGIGWTYHARFSLPHGLGWPLYGAGLAGMAWLAWMRVRVAILLCAYPLAYYLAAGGGYMVYVRYMLPVVPFLCLTAAVAVMALARGLARVARLPAPLVAAALAVVVISASAATVVRFDRLLRQRDSRLVAGEWVRANVPAGVTIYQAGNAYGHLQLEATRPFRYRHWTWDRDANKFRDETGRFTEGWPDWIVAHESALPYSHVPDRVSRELRWSYLLVHMTRAVDAREPLNVYDIQDAFFLPYGGFVQVRRPGPNVFVYRKRTLD